MALIFSMIILFPTCGYFENDGIKFSKKIVGNFYLYQFKNDDGIVLVLKESNSYSSTWIVNDCRLVYYDSTESIIYAESPITDVTSTFYRVVIMDSSSHKPLKAYSKNEIYESTFKNSIAKGNAKRVKLN